MMLANSASTSRLQGPEMPRQTRGDSASDLQAAYRMLCLAVLGRCDDGQDTVASHTDCRKQTKRIEEFVVIQQHVWHHLPDQTRDAAPVPNPAGARAPIGGKGAPTASRSDARHERRAAHEGGDFACARAAALPQVVDDGATANRALDARLYRAEVAVMRSAKHTGMTPATSEGERACHTAHIAPTTVSGEIDFVAPERPDGSRERHDGAGHVAPSVVAETARAHPSPVPKRDAQTPASMLPQRGDRAVDSASVESPETPATRVQYQFRTWEGQPTVDLHFEGLDTGHVVMVHTNHTHVQAAMERSIDRLTPAVAIKFAHRGTDDGGGRSRDAHTDRDEDADEQ